MLLYVNRYGLGNLTLREALFIENVLRIVTNTKITPTYRISAVKKVKICCHNALKFFICFLRTIPIIFIFYSFIVP